MPSTVITANQLPTDPTTTIDPIEIITVSITDLKALLIDQSFLGRVSERDFPINTTWEKRRSIFWEWAIKLAIPYSDIAPFLTYFDEQDARMKANARKPKPRQLRQETAAINDDTMDVIADKIVERLNTNKPSKTSSKWLDEPTPTIMDDMQWYSKCDTCKQPIDIDPSTGKRTGFRWRFGGKFHCYHLFAPCFRTGCETLFNDRLEARDRMATGIMGAISPWEEAITG